jgi:hypothetical protein
VDCIVFVWVDLKHITYYVVFGSIGWTPILATFPNREFYR